MKNHSKKRGILATLGALVTATALALGGAAAANAVTIDSGSTVNLNITKLTTPTDAPLAPTGQVLQTLPAGAAPIADVKFTVKRMVSYVPTAAGTPTTNVDLTTNAGWQAAADITFDADTGDWFNGGVAITPTFDTARTGVTDGFGIPQKDGSDAFQGMPIGLYHVAETDTPAGVTPAVPFVVALPMTNPTDKDAWLYTVQVYPKNSTTSLTKTVDDTAAYVAGGTNNIVWTLNATVPRVNTSTDPETPIWDAPTAFVVSDTLDSHLHAIATGDAVVSLVTGTGGTTAVLADGADYTFEYDISTKTVTVTMMTAGLAQLGDAAATAGSHVLVAITSQVDLGAAAINGAVSNGGTGVNLDPTTTKASATFTVAGNETTITSNVVASNWHDVTFNKVAHEAPATPLEGAVFALYKTSAHAKAATNAIATSAATVANGLVTMSNVRASNFENGVLLTAVTNYRVYWLAETVAPSGYELLAEPIPVVLLSNGLLQKVTTADGVITEAGDLSTIDQVENVKANAGFQLPLTGGMGTAILTIAGISILAIVLLVARRRRDTETAAE